MNLPCYFQAKNAEKPKKHFFEYLFRKEDYSPRKNRYVFLNFIKFKIDKQENAFDFIVSLGGNCSAASQCLRRGLRNFSLPFDWAFMANEMPVRYFAKGLKDGFKDLLKKENLKELQGSERGDEKEKWQYKDTCSEYRFIHLFGDDIQKEGVYEKGVEIIRRRIARLYQKLNKSKRVLVICATDFVFDENAMYEVKQAFESLYPQTEFVFYTLMFRSDKEKSDQNGNMHFIYSKRSVNEYDVVKTNFEWAFLDKVYVKKQKKLIFFKKNKSSFGIYFLPFIGTIVNLRGQVFRWFFELGIGKKSNDNLL